MPRFREVFTRYRLLSLAVLVSAALHAAIFIGAPGGMGPQPESSAVLFSASLEPGGMVLDEAAGPQPAPRPKPAAR
jgi:hypothetical protein